MKSYKLTDLLLHSILLLILGLLPVLTQMQTQAADIITVPRAVESVVTVAKLGGDYTTIGTALATRLPRPVSIIHS